MRDFMLRVPDKSVNGALYFRIEHIPSSTLIISGVLTYRRLPLLVEWFLQLSRKPQLGDRKP